MKKALIFLIACLASTTMFAAGEFFEVEPVPTQPFYTKLISVLMIDGVEQFNTDLEIGAFDPDDVCRGTAKGAANPRTGRVIFSLRFKAVDEGTEMHFKVYDHASQTILDLVADFDEVITYQGNYTYQWNGSNSSAMNPYEANFTYAGGGFTKDIHAYTPETMDYYYLIASPVGDEAIVENLRENDYDLYKFDQAEELEWINDKEYPNDPFTIDAGVGYLYANSENITLTFTANPDFGPIEDEETTLWLNFSDANTCEDMWGWNLMGNPFGDTAYLGENRAFYRIVEGESELSEAHGAIAPMEGFFVKANEPQEPLLITKVQPAKSPRLSLNVSSSSRIVDRAAVNFKQGQPLPKFQLNPNHTKVYFPMDGKDYAVVSSEGMGEMPVNFKAETNGTYTMSFTNEEVTFGYLHLIDNMTGTDTDLLETPSYTFNAKTTDYASRFKLVYATGSAEDENFAFCSDGNWIINNEGAATLQVVDVTGRILKSESINGCANVNINAAKGVYMLRLINGNNMKVQKVVVK